MARRLYLPLVVDFFDDIDLVEASLVSPWCELLYVRCACIAKEEGTDGVVRPGHLARSRVPNPGRWVKVLVEKGLWTSVEGGYAIRSWTKHNLTTEQVTQKRAASNRRVTEHRAAKNATGNTTGNASSNGACNALPLKRKVEGVSNNSSPTASPPPGADPKPLTRHQALSVSLARHADGIETDDRGTSLSKRDWGRLGPSAQSILGVEPEADDARVGRAVAEYRKRNPGTNFTSETIADWWTRLKAAPKAAATSAGFGVGQRSSAS